MSPRSAFPIMMGSGRTCCRPPASVSQKAGRFDGTVALALTLGGIPGVLIAAFVVKSLPLHTIRWLVVAVVLYASFSMLAAARARGSPSSEPASANK